MDILTIIILVVLAGLVFWVIGVFNSLVVLKNRAKEAWSDIDVQLKRRYDLIPNLVETVKGYATHERELLEKVTQARASAMGAKGTHDKAEAENMLYNTNVRDLNIKIEIFPANLVANMMGFKQMELFEAGEQEKEPVKVKF